LVQRKDENTSLLSPLRVKLAQFLREFVHDESGQDLLEYALVLAAVLASVAEGSESLSKTLSHEMKRITHEIKSLHIG